MINTALPSYRSHGGNTRVRRSQESRCHAMPHHTTPPPKDRQTHARARENLCLVVELSINTHNCSLHPPINHHITPQDGSAGNKCHSTIDGRNKQEGRTNTNTKNIQHMSCRLLDYSRLTVLVRDPDVDLAVEPAEPAKGGVHRVRPVGRPDHHHLTPPRHHTTRHNTTCQGNRTKN